MRTRTHLLLLNHHGIHDARGCESPHVSHQVDSAGPVTAKNYRAHCRCSKNTKQGWNVFYVPVCLKQQDFFVGARIHLDERART